MVWNVKHHLAVMSLLMLAGLGGCSKPPAVESVAFRSWGGPGGNLGQFTHPRAVACHGQEVFIIDKSGRVQVFRRDGIAIREWRMPDQDHGTPTSIGVSPEGDLWIPDTHNSRILVYDPDGTLESIFGSFGSGPGEFTFVTGVTHAPNGDFYVCEFGTDDRVQQFRCDGTFIRSFGRHGEGPGEMSRPMALIYHPLGRIYVADAANHRVQCFSPKGEFLFSWGERGELPGQLTYPYDIALDGKGFLYVCEFGNHRVQKFAPDGMLVKSWGAAGTGGGELFTPWGVEVDDRGTLYVADTGNHRIVVLEGASSVGSPASDEIVVDPPWPGMRQSAMELHADRGT